MRWRIVSTARSLDRAFWQRDVVDQIARFEAEAGRDEAAGAAEGAKAGRLRFQEHAAANAALEQPERRGETS
jgi:hypothetical protein